MAFFSRPCVRINQFNSLMGLSLIVLTLHPLPRFDPIYLVISLRQVPFEDPVHTNERSDFPSCELPAGIKQVVVRTLQGATNNILEIFFYHCVNSMVTDLSKGMLLGGFGSPYANFVTIRRLSLC